ncbi:hypothetical protein ASPZODRAFT_136535 [Penicilliopsis zonata CBS 506.65]|uniref:Hepatocellular carcinoma-associated antigen 59-domain-containing protein n=1 Tax=Penicilliopsis zonata CBS 506.65 TaxID=1073090 RepID=A0A1L9S832_9EURO|nr:hypothetical protein ASPZODRAFT_136535 [Penicilliopsis zonata CBS 506.65]OJJ43311.1 hypothetical protein ASPZODRAFT_136535 [Penicilliopsis zonata CBS 506.65]
MDTDIQVSTKPLFRPVKRRKFMRRREDESDNIEDDLTATEDSHRMQSHYPLITDQSSSNAHMNSLRRPFRARKGGIEFSTEARQVADSVSTRGTGAEDPESVRLRAMSDRFTGHTGQRVDVDKHMMAFIDSEMAKRQRNSPSEPPVTDAAPPVVQVASEQLPSAFVPREPASIGKLHEIDLGEETKLQNIVRTEAAARRLAGNGVPGAAEEGVARSGKHGKSWRDRRRRNSEDIERDKLVEEVLRESKLDVYNEPEEEEPLDDQAADDRIAEQFRRDFLDAIQSRRRVARAKAASKAPTKTDAPRGPKLGGSRSARAAMRESQEKAGQK